MLTRLNLISATLHDVKFIDPETRFINTDMVDFYLASPMEEAAYMMVLLKDIPMSIVNDYDLSKRTMKILSYQLSSNTKLYLL